MNVGTSPQRTPAKHDLLDKLVGREVGVLQTAAFQQQWGAKRYVAYDLCAGDGRDNPHSGTSSPAILHKHLSYLLKHGGDGEVRLVERDEATYTALAAQVSGWTGVKLANKDARDIRVHHDDGDVVMVHNDPNALSDFALSPQFVAALPFLTTTLSTLGCNVGGLKRLSRSERAGWYGHIEVITEVMQRHHDALLVSLNGDASQWAYLLTGPITWRERYEQDVRKSFAGWEQGVSTAWFRLQPSLFDEMVDDLFLTKSERKALV